MSSTLKIYVLALVSFLVGTSEYVIAGILDRIADTMNISLIAAGQLITIFHSYMRSVHLSLLH